MRGVRSHRPVERLRRSGRPDRRSPAPDGGGGGCPAAVVELPPAADPTGLEPAGAHRHPADEAPRPDEGWHAAAAARPRAPHRATPGQDTRALPAPHATRTGNDAAAGFRLGQPLRVGDPVLREPAAAPAGAARGGGPAPAIAANGEDPAAALLGAGHQARPGRAPAAAPPGQNDAADPAGFQCRTGTARTPDPGGLSFRPPERQPVRSP